MNRQSIFFTITVSFIISVLLVIISFLILITNNHRVKEGQFLDKYIPIAKNFYETFIEVDKNRKDFYQENYERFLDEIDDTFLKIKQKMSGSEITTIYAFDDYWDIFANRFRLNIIKKEKKYLNISDVSETLEFTQNKNIKKLLFYRGMDYNIALSLSSNLNVEILEDDIFGDNWQYNLLNLSQNLFK